jgi:transposase
LDDAFWRRRLRELSGRYELHAAFEIGPHYEWMYDLLKAFADDVQVVNAADFAVISRSQKKTDKIDAQKLAEGLLRGDLPTVAVPDGLTRADRRLVSFLHWNSQQLVAVKGRLRGMLFTHRVVCPHRDVFGRQAQRWLEETQQHLPEGDALLLELLLEEGRMLIEHRKRLDAEAARRVKRYEQAPLLRSIPGFGTLTTLAVLCAVFDIRRFRSPEQFSSYFGLCGRVYQSGQTLRIGGLTKRGNVHVRWLLSQVLLHLHRKDPRARKRYQRLKRRKAKGVARGAQVRWLATIVWQMLQKGEAYRIGGQPA